MLLRHAAIAALAAASLASCGKSAKDPSPSTTDKVVEGGGGATNGGGGGGATGSGTGTAPAKAPSRGPEHPVHSLVDNRLSAHLSRGGGVLLPAGSAGFAKYVRVGNVFKGGAKKSWDLRQKDGDIPVAKLTGKTASVFVPLTAAQSKRGLIRVRMKSEAAGAVSVRVNENKDINVQAAAGWQTLELKVPEGQLKEGENGIQFFMASSGSSVAWIQVGGESAVGDDGAIGFYDGGSKALVLPKGGGSTYYAYVPDKALVSGDLSDGSCTVNVLATAEDGAVVEGKLTGTGSAVDLASLGGKAVRLDLEGAGCDESKLANAALVVPGAAPAGTPTGATPPKYVVFFIMDSLRADRIKPFDEKARPEVPVWEKLAGDSTLFMQHYVQGNESLVSHSSMWASMYLAKHKVAGAKEQLPDDYVTIDDVAKKAGKFVAGVSANGYIRPARGFGVAWNEYVNHIEKSMGLKGLDVYEKGIKFITPKKDQPWFLYLGTIDTHVTWRAKQPWLDKYDPGYKGKYADSFGDDGSGGVPKGLSESEMNHVRALYDSNVSYQDELLGKLIAQLEQWGIWNETMLIITADHGDEQWEDGRVGHGGSQKETLVHVPLLIHYPPMFPAAKIKSGTEGIDIVPTLAEALGQPADANWQGMSLVGLANGAIEYPLMSTSSQYENYIAGRIRQWKGRLGGTGAPQIYNVVADPGEKKDLYGTASAAIATRVVLDPLWMLRQWNADWKKSQWGNAASVSSRFAADLGE